MLWRRQRARLAIEPDHQLMAARPAHVRRFERLSAHVASASPASGGSDDVDAQQQQQSTSRLSVAARLYDDGIHRRSTLGRLYDPSNVTPETIFAPDGHCDYYGDKGFLSADPAVRPLLLEIPTEELAPATVPPACGYEETPPALWTAGDWAALEERQRREPLFDMDEVRRQAATQDFAADGYAVFKNIMTPETQRQWTAALQLCQTLNDRLIASDWSESVDWETLRVPAPTEFHTDADKAGAYGGAQRLKPMNDANGGFAMRLHGVLPEYFPPAHVSYLMFVLFHPQLLDLHAMFLQCDPTEIYYSTAQSNNKRAGDPGARWHSHGKRARAHACTLLTARPVQPATCPRG